MKKEKYFVCPPEFSDGSTNMVTDEKQAIIDGLKSWMAEAEDGESITIKVRAMTEKEFNALPEL